MAKEKRSTEQLAQIVSEHLGAEGVSVTVMADTVDGWNAFAMTAPEA